MAENNAMIMFKRGPQNRLPSTATDGVFYLTTDTNRLYVGQGETMALLNQTVQIVQNVAALPASPALNDFYYCTDENVLAVYNGTKWQQINPDTNTNDDTYISSVDVADGVISDNAITYAITVNQTTKDVLHSTTKEAASVNFDLVLTKEELKTLLPDPTPANVGLDLVNGAESNTVKIATVGNGSDDANAIIVAGGENVSVSMNNDVLTIAAEDSTYALQALEESNKALVRLHYNEKNTNDDIQFLAGDNMDVEASADGIKYSHAAIELTETEGNAQSLSYGDTVTLVSEVKSTNKDGHINEIVTTAYTLPAAITIAEVTGKNDNDWKVTIKESNNITHDIDFSADAAKLKSDLEDAIAEGLAAANTALTYKGTIDTYDALASKTNIEIGDVWLLNQDSGDYKLGDMFIATVEADGDHIGGIITSGKVVWTYVPSGDELNTDTLFYGDVTISTSGAAEGGSITYTLKAKHGGDDNHGVDPTVPDANEDLIITAGKDILITSADGAATIAHKEYGDTTPGAATSANSSAEFTAITGISIENGHVTEIQQQKFTPRTYDLEGANNAITLKNSSNAAVGSVSVVGDSWVSASVANNTLSISHNGPQGNLTDKSVTNGTLTHGGSLNILTGVKYDSKGHVSEVTTGSVTLPADNDTTYDLLLSNSASGSASVGDTAVKDPYVILRNSKSINDTIQVSGDNGSLSVQGKNGNIAISMVWGSF